MEEGTSVFGGTAFCTFGLFWSLLQDLILMPLFGWIEGPEPLAFVAYLFL